MSNKNYSPDEQLTGKSWDVIGDNFSLYPNTAWQPRVAGIVVTYPNEYDVLMEKPVTSGNYGIVASFERSRFNGKDVYINFELEVVSGTPAFLMYIQNHAGGELVTRGGIARAGRNSVCIPYGVIPGEKDEFRVLFGLPSASVSTILFKNITVTTVPMWAAAPETALTDIGKSFSPAAGKNVLLMGASNVVQWAPYFRSYTGCGNAFDVSSGGANITDYPETVHDGNTSAAGGNVVSNQVVKALANKAAYDAAGGIDIIIINCVRNDGTPKVPPLDTDFEQYYTANNAAVDVDSLTLGNNMYGSIRWIVEKLRAPDAFPGAQIFLTNCNQAGTDDSNTPALLKRKNRCIENSCRRLSIGLLDLYGCGIYDIYENDEATRRHTTDGTHFNEAGGELVGRFIANEVRNRLPRFVF